MSLSEFELGLNRAFFRRADADCRNPRSLSYKKLRMVLPLFKTGERFLDVGCGTGELLLRLNDRYKILAGIDLNPCVLDIARKKLFRLKNIAVLQQDFMEYSSAKKYDACAMLDFLEHVSDPEKVLAKAGKLLRNGGQLVISVPNWYDKIKMFLGLSPFHKVAHSSLGWIAVLKRAGFQVDEIKTVEFPLIHSEFLSERLHLFGKCVILSCTKT